MSRPRPETMPAVTVPPSPKGVADRDHPVADPGAVRIPELDHRQRLAGVDLEERQIGPRIDARDPCFELAPVLKRDRHRLRCLHHVVAGDDEPRSVDDESGTDALRPRHVGHGESGHRSEVPEHLRELHSRPAPLRARVGGGPDGAGHLNIDDGRAHLAHEVGEAALHRGHGDPSVCRRIRRVPGLGDGDGTDDRGRYCRRDEGAPDAGFRVHGMFCVM